jgi:hypothetical protein
MDVKYAYDTANSPAEGVDVAPDVLERERHLLARHGTSSAAWPADHHRIAAIAGIALVALLLGCLWRTFGGAGRDKSKRTARASLPAFDVEGGGSGGGSKVLHPSVSQAAATADVAAVRQWLSDERCVVDAARAAGGGTALHAAAAHGHANVVRMLLDGGADALVVDSDLRTPLHLVAMAGHGLCVKALCDAGADPEAKDGQGESPLACVAAHGLTRRRPHAADRAARARPHAHAERRAARGFCAYAGWPRRPSIWARRA